MSETGHAKNVANFETATLALTALGADYAPPQPLILLPALQAQLAAAKASLAAKSQTAAAKTLAVDAREAEYDASANTPTTSAERRQSTSTTTPLTPI